MLLIHKHEWRWELRTNEDSMLDHQLVDDFMKHYQLCNPCAYNTSAYERIENSD